MQQAPPARRCARILVSAFVVAGTLTIPAAAQAQLSPESQPLAGAGARVQNAATGAAERAQSQSVRTQVAQAEAARSAAAQVGFQGVAYGSQLYNTSRSLIHGPTAFSTIGCGAQPGAVSTNTTSQGNLPGALGRLGAQTTEVRAVDSGGTRSTISRSETEAVNLLGGLITSGGVSSSTQTSRSGTTFRTIQSSALLDLEILGQPVSATPAPNTRIDLRLPVVGNIGYVELNRQVSGPSGGGYLANTTALHLVLLADNPYLPGRGVHLWLGHSTANLTPEAVGTLFGNGFATRILLANGTVSSGPTALALISCNGGEHTNTAAATRAGDVVRGGAATTVAVGSTSSTNASSKVTQTIAGLDVLDGAVTAEAIKAVATATRVGGGPVQVTDEGSGFANLRIGGRPVAAADLAPGSTVRALGGAIEVTLHKIDQNSEVIVVTMIEIVIRDATLGLPVGSRIQIGRAQAGIHSMG
jgi:hypothetical protein